MGSKGKRRSDGVSFRNFDQAWYSSLTGSYLPLRDEAGYKIKGREREQDAKRAYARLVLSVGDRGNGHPAPAITAGLVCDSYLTFLRTERAAKSWQTVKYWLSHWLRFVGDDTPACDLDSRSVTDWIDANRASWKSNNTIHRAMSCVMSALSYAAKRGSLRDRDGRKIPSPLVGLAKPAMSAKIVLITPEQEEAIFAEIGADPARDYLRFLLATGCRPEEGATIEARHLQETPNGVLIVLGVGEHKTGRKTGKQRIIYCGAVASEIVRRLALRYPAGKLFRTRAGSTWLPSTRVGWFSRLRDRVQAERGKDFCPDTISLYACRHTFATRKLAEGKPIAHVAELLGNTIAVCQTHYGHLALMGNVLWSCVA